MVTTKQKDWINSNSTETLIEQRNLLGEIRNALFTPNMNSLYDYLIKVIKKRKCLK